jgi:hypothetical protein
MKHVLFVLTILLCVGCSQSQGQPSTVVQAKTNWELLEGVVSHLTREIVNGVELRPHEQVLLRVGKSENSWMVENKLIDVLRGAGADVFVSSGSKSDSMTIGEFNVLDLKLQYIRVFEIREEKCVEREASVRVSGKVYRVGDGKVLWGNTVGRTQTDTVRIDDMPNLEDPSIKVTHADLPEQGIFSSVIEPVLVIAASVIIIFLFFAVRSG